MIKTKKIILITMNFKRCSKIKNINKDHKHINEEEKDHQKDFYDQTIKI